MSRLSMASNRQLRKLPNLIDTKVKMREHLFIQKLRQCCVLFDFSKAEVDKISCKVKESALVELRDYIFTRKDVITKALCPEIVNMFICNVFRTLSPSPIPKHALFHLSLVYKFFLEFLRLPDLKPNYIKRYIDRQFVQQLLELFDSGYEMERDFLKRILHRIYAVFYELQLYIRKQIHDALYKFIYETEHHNGVFELLEVLESIINGLTLPLKEEYLVLHLNILMSLHKVKELYKFNKILMYCVLQFLKKDPRLAKVVAGRLLQFWPKMHGLKEEIFLEEMKNIILIIEPDEFKKVMVKIFRQLAKCILSDHHRVAQAALVYWSNEHIMSLVSDNTTVLLPIIVPSLYAKSSSLHWNKNVNDLVHKAQQTFMKMNRRLYDECVQNYSFDGRNEYIEKKKREKAWTKIETLANKNILKGMASLNDNIMFKSAASDITPVDEESKEYTTTPASADLPRPFNEESKAYNPVPTEQNYAFYRRKQNIKLKKQEDEWKKIETFASKNCTLRRMTSLNTNIMLESDIALVDGKEYKDPPPADLPKAG